jgi:putative transcriptional regulator
MTSARLWCAIVLALAAVLRPPSLSAAFPKQGLTSEEPSLRGRLLLASPSMGDPRFRRTVILMVKHDKSGALGITINRPVGVRALATLLEAMGQQAPPGTGTVSLFAGGPVQTGAGFVVHSTEYERKETARVNEDVSVTSSADVLLDMAAGKGPQKALVAFGYAGWAPGQLEAELARDDWLIAPAEPALVFDTAREKVWDEAMARREREP